MNDSGEDSVLGSTAVRAALKALDPRSWWNTGSLPSWAQSDGGMTKIYKGVMDQDFTDIAERGFAPSNAPTYVTTNPAVADLYNISSKGTGGGTLVGEALTDSLKGGSETISAADKFDQAKITAGEANKAFGFTEGDARVLQRDRIGPFAFPLDADNLFLKAGKGAAKILGRAAPGLGAAGGALAAHDYGEKEQHIRQALALASMAPFGLGTVPFGLESGINVVEGLTGNPTPDYAADPALSNFTAGWPELGQEIPRRATIDPIMDPAKPTKTEIALDPASLSTLNAFPSLSPDDQFKAAVTEWRVGQQIPQSLGGTRGSGGAVPSALKAMAYEPLGLKVEGFPSVGVDRRPDKWTGKQDRQMQALAHAATAENPYLRVGLNTYNFFDTGSWEDAVQDEFADAQAKKIRGYYQAEEGRNPNTQEYLTGGLSGFEGIASTPKDIIDKAKAMDQRGEKYQSGFQKLQERFNSITPHSRGGTALVGPDTDSPEVAAQFDVNDRSLASRAALKAFGGSQDQRSLYQDPISFIQNQTDIQGAVDYLNRTQNEEARSYIAPISMADTGRITDTGVISPTDPIELETTPVINALNMMVDKGITNVMPGTAPVEFTPTINPRLVDAAHLVPDITPQAFDDFVTSSVLGVDIPKTTKKKDIPKTTKKKVDRDPKDAGQRPVVKALQQEQKKATQKVADLEKQQKDHRAKIDKGGESAEAAGKFEAKRLYNEHQAALASEKALKSQNTMATLLQAMNIQRSEELARRERDRLERERRARLYGDAFDPSGRR